MGWKFRKKRSDTTRPLRSGPVTSGDNLTTAFSYHANRSNKPKESDRNRPSDKPDSKENTNKYSKFMSWFFLTILLAVLIVLTKGLYVSSNAKVIIVQPNGYSYMPHSQTQYQQVTDKIIGSSIYNKLKITLSSRDIGQNIQQSFPEVSYVAVTVPFIGSRPTVYIQLTKPALVYVLPAGSYVLDSNGLVIANAASFKAKELASLPTVQSALSSNITDGEQLLSNQDVNFIQTISLGLKDKNIAVTKMELISGAQEIDVYPANQKYFIKFNLHQTDALLQLGTYLAAIATLKQENKIPNSYIDVRVDGRAYYK